MVECSTEKQLVNLLKAMDKYKVSYMCRLRVVLVLLTSRRILNLCSVLFLWDSILNFI
jgi:hypothetical protein